MTEQYRPRRAGPARPDRRDPPDTAVFPGSPPVSRAEPTERLPDRPGRRFDADRLWAGGAATALVAGLLAVLGILVARGLLDVAVLAPKGEGVWGNANTLTYALVSMGCALVATGFMQLLLMTTPNAVRFFSWIMVLTTLIAVVLPLSVHVALESRVFTAVLNFLIGLVITLLLCGVAASARRKWDAASWR